MIDTRVYEYIRYGYIMLSTLRQSEELTPLTPAVFHILLALASGRKHGYAIMKEVAADGGGSLRMGPGTLYGSLQRMTAAGLVEETEEADGEEDERRRYYQLTSMWRRALGGETARLRQALSAAKRKGVTAPVRGSAR
jgi:DNA-binding PadR family transcriptional regulator